MKDRTLKYLPYIIIICLLTLSTFLYHRWDTEKKERVKIESTYNSEKTVFELEQKNLELLKKVEDQNQILKNKIDQIDNSLSSLYKKEEAIKPPSQEQYNEIEKADITGLHNLYSSMGYPTKIRR